MNAKHYDNSLGTFVSRKTDEEISQEMEKQLGILAITQAKMEAILAEQEKNRPNPGQCEWCSSDGCRAEANDLEWHALYHDNGQLAFAGWYSDGCLDLIQLCVEAIDNDNT